MCGKSQRHKIEMFVGMVSHTSLKIDRNKQMPDEWNNETDSLKVL